MSPDGRWLAWSGHDGVEARDTRGGGPVLGAFAPAYRRGPALGFTPDGSRLAVAAASRIDFWEVESWRPLPSLDFGVGMVKALAFSPDGLLGAAGGTEGRVAVFDLD